MKEQKIKYSNKITLYGCSFPVAQNLINQYNYGSYDSFKTTDIIFNNCIRCAELDLIAKDYINKLENLIEKLKLNPPEWVDLSMTDEELEKDYMEQALLDEYFIFSKYEPSALIHVNQRSLNFSWDVIRKYEWDGLSLLQSYTFTLQKVQIIRQDEPFRKAAEKMEKFGIANRGKNIPYKKIFDKFTIAQLKTILNGIDIKKTIKKADLIELLISQEDVDYRLSNLCAIDDVFLFNMFPSDITEEWLNDGLIYYRYCSQVNKYLFDSTVNCSRPLQLNWIDKINPSVPQ